MSLLGFEYKWWIRMDYLVIGCGLTGSVIARHLAEKGERVTIWERRNHIGGNMYDYVDDNGILVHKYGPHVFHTDSEAESIYMKQYGSWVDFPIKCRVNMLGKVTPSPFNFQTIDDYYSSKDAECLKSELLREYKNRDKVTIVELLQSHNAVVREYADFLFKHDYSLYTAKQWGMRPEDVDPSILKRVPVLLSYKDGYFDDKWQMVPCDGYTEWFKELLSHTNIRVELNTEALDRISIICDAVYLDGELFHGVVIYTGPIDELFNKKYGALPYRSLEFAWKTVNEHQHLPAALVAYPEAEGYTRITEYNHFPQKDKKDVSSLAFEYPVMYEEGIQMEPYYPLLTTESLRKYELYEAEADSITNLVVAGRLAKFKYYNMNQALTAALEVAESIQ